MFGDANLREKSSETFRVHFHGLNFRDYLTSKLAVLHADYPQAWRVQCTRAVLDLRGHSTLCMAVCTCLAQLYAFTNKLFFFVYLSSDLTLETITIPWDRQPLKTKMLSGDSSGERRFKRHRSP